jgi:5-methylthioadenosine/S-adenosylhomocysteine deaminase
MTIDDPTLQRRRFIHGMSAMALIASAPLRAQGVQASAASSDAEPAPDSGSLLIRGGTVLTMDARSGDHPRADVLIRAGNIAAVGPNLAADGVPVLDARGAIVMPGLIDTHWHMWNSLARSYAPTASGTRFFEAMKTLSAAYEPDDSYLAVRYALAEAAAGGITSVTNWAHNIRGPEHADAELRAMFESGMGGRFLYGYPQDAAATRTNDFADIARVRKQYFDGPRGLVDLGVAIRGPERTPAAVWREEMAYARRQGLPFSVHVAVTREAQKQRAIDQMHTAAFLDAATELVHVTHASDGDLRVIAAAKSNVVITPFTEMRVGYGIAPVMRMLGSGIRPTLGNDTTVLAGNADLFDVMRVVLGLANGQAEDELAVPARRVLEMATIDAARSLGLDARIGSLVPGKQADVIVLDASRLAAAPLTDALAFVAGGAQPEQVRDVLVAGRFVKRAGRLMRVDAPQLAQQADAAWHRLQGRAARTGSL